MATYQITYTAEGIVKHELTYKNESFSYSMIPDQFGTTSDKKAFEYQIKERFPNEKEKILNAFDELSLSDEDDITELLVLLSKEEKKSKA